MNEGCENVKKYIHILLRQTLRKNVFKNSSKIFVKINLENIKALDIWVEMQKTKKNSQKISEVTLKPGTKNSDSQKSGIENNYKVKVCLNFKISKYIFCYILFIFGC
eukprot:TCONS_00070906-protein